ncbi:MAG: single-stranded-DNA-specific exonuclease RecJ [Cyanothece sp. SIO1E1]|nr:single-stranded-DNA-specific exonuclease RecJ [Cyanothece sp. SIO1E1]
MVEQIPQWQIQPPADIPIAFMQAVKQHAPELSGYYAAQLLWQRGIQDVNQLRGFLDPHYYQPASPFEFGQEMTWAVERLQQAHAQTEKVAIWGDFDADGITATSVLWDGLRQFFPTHEQLAYFIPNRLTESHGLSDRGLEQLAHQGYQLIVTCDTGSTNLTEIEYARTLNIDLIITDHHTLPAERPPVIAMINPRNLPEHHPLAHLSGVAVAYKLVEALYQVLPGVPQRPLAELLDLVAIGLIADLVQLTGDCRYLAQIGIERLQQQLSSRRVTASNAATPTDPSPTRPGIARLLELCKRNGDRPTDISFGLGPRINAVSRIQGDASDCVELLTSQDQQRCRQLAETTELANARRKSLQKDVAQRVSAQLAHLDLSTTHVIVLADPQWPVGILGLVAGQIAQTYGRPTILLSAETIGPDDSNSATLMARGSARSVNQIDLYQLVKDQAHLLNSFGGHPLAAGLSMPVANIPLFTAAINRQCRQLQAISAVSAPVLSADLTVTVAELSPALFRELKLLEPCGMGNPVPKLLIQNCWFDQPWNRNIKDWRGGKIRYIKTEFRIRDDSTKSDFPGVWWEHYKEDLPIGYCDAIIELDFNTYQKRYEIRIIAVRPGANHKILTRSPHQTNWILDYRTQSSESSAGIKDADASKLEPILAMTQCPASWHEFQWWVRRAQQARQSLAIAYPPPDLKTPADIWQTLIGIAKYLSRTGQTATQTQLQQKLDISGQVLKLGLVSLTHLGFNVVSTETSCQITQTAKAPLPNPNPEANDAIGQFLAAIQEEQFRRRYFYQVPVSTLQAIATQALLTQTEGS